MHPPRPARPRHWAKWLGRNLARLHYARHVEPTWLEVNELCVPVRGLPPAFDGFRIAHLTDLHAGKQLPAAYLAEAIDLTLAQEPDMVVVTGDFIHHGFRHVRDAAAVAGRLSAPHGVFAVLGNHDYSIRNAFGFRRHPRLHQAVADALVDNGVSVLRNETRPLVRGGDELLLTGVDDLWSRECDLDKAYADGGTGARLVLAHNPRTVEQLGERRCDLMLSGHTHGGQVNLPKLGRVTLGKKAKRWAAGAYRYGDTYLYVNKGVGFGWRLRFGVRPEVAVLTLHRGENSCD